MQVLWDFCFLYLAELLDTEGLQFGHSTIFKTYEPKYCKILSGNDRSDVNYQHYDEPKYCKILSYSAFLFSLNPPDSSRKKIRNWNTVERIKRFLTARAFAISRFFRSFIDLNI